MELVLTEEQELLRTTAADFVKQSCPVSRLRTLRDSDDRTGFSAELWRRMAELGWPGIVLPEDVGGLGLGYTELVVVLEELGRALAPEPFLSTVLLGANAVLLGGTPAQKSQILPSVATGDLLLALAYHEPGAREDVRRVKTRATADGSERFRLVGVKDFVLGGTAANRMVVSARTGGAANDADGITLFLIDPTAAGVRIERTRLVDARLAALVHLDDVVVSAADRIGEVGKGAALLDAILDRALVGLSAEMLGGMAEAFDRTVEYLKTRDQFGVKIGTFQALKHRAAKVFTEIELARSAVMAAARAMDAASAEAPALASLAKAKCSEAFLLAANEAVQMHGGIGMTDEHEIGFFLKRARAAEIQLGDAIVHRDRWARLNAY